MIPRVNLRISIEAIAGGPRYYRRVHRMRSLDRPNPVAWQWYSALRFARRTRVRGGFPQRAAQSGDRAVPVGLRRCTLRRAPRRLSFVLVAIPPLSLSFIARARTLLFIRALLFDRFDIGRSFSLHAMTLLTIPRTQLRRCTPGRAPRRLSLVVVATSSLSFIAGVIPGRAPLFARDCPGGWFFAIIAEISDSTASTSAARSPCTR
mmetsp:Transcript_10990/g.20455  ORF Transcript_10990/g.20455 Transcript_10990/m.20455 type:complete len:206 (+) Transcript_10990:763-1380(+)